MLFKSEFKRRLSRLKFVLDYTLEQDRFHPNFFPYLFSVISFLWSNIDQSKFLKK